MTDFVTIDKVKAWLGIGGTGDDQLLTNLITNVSAFVDQYLSRDILTASYVETRDGTGGTRLVTREFPITAVSAVSIDGLSIPASSGPGVAGYTFNATSISLRGYQFTRDMNNVSISYTAGYATIPQEVEQACLELIAMRYREKSRVGMSSQAMAGETTTYVTKDMPDSVKTTLNQFRRVVPV